MFTYGTLKSGQTNHHILTNTENGRATLLGPAKTLKKWPLVLVSAYEIPCLLPLEDVGHEVSGELYLIDDRMLSVLDSLETHPDVYVRVQEDVVSLPQQANSSALDAEAVSVRKFSLYEHCRTAKSVDLFLAQNRERTFVDAFRAFLRTEAGHCVSCV